MYFKNFLVTRHATGTYQRRSRSRLSQLGNTVILLSVITICGCATNKPFVETLGDAATTVKQGVGKIVEKVQSRGPSDKSKNNNSSSVVAAKFPKTEVPHILMRKPVASGRLSSTFGYRANPTGFIPFPKKHKGIDYAAPTGTPVYSAGTGEVVKIYVSRSYGNYVKIKHANGFATAYAHLDEFEPGLQSGDTVVRGQKIGTVGNTGSSTNPHLHFELHYKGKPVDPLLQK